MDSRGARAKPATRTRRILAVLLAIRHVGLGHAVMGYPRRGLIWVAAVLLGICGMLLGGISGIRYVWWLAILAGIGIRLGSVVDTLRLRAPLVAPGKLRTVLAGVAMVAITSLAGLGTTRFVRSYRQPTIAMSPSLEQGEYFVASHVWDQHKRGEVIVFDYPMDPSKAYVMRLIGLPEDTVEIRDGMLILNGSPVDTQATDTPCDPRCSIFQETLDGNVYSVTRLNDDYFKELWGGAKRDDPRTFGPERIPEKHVFVLGDNRDNSADSRYWGYVPIELVRAKPKFIYWSSGEFGIRWSRINRMVE
jgi:signal peptidase I